MLRITGRILLWAGLVLLLALVFGRSFADFYTEALWYGSLDQAAVFWTRFAAGLATRLVAGGLGAVIILLNLWIVLRQLGPVHLRRRYGNLEIAEQVPRSLLIAGIITVSLLAGVWLSSIEFSGGVPVAALAWLNRVPWGAVDPLFGRDLGFYIFSYPLYRRLLDFVLIVVIWSALLVAIGYVLVGAVRLRGNRVEVDDKPRVHFAALVAALVFLLGVRYWFGRFGLLLDGSGFGDATGYTDVHARLPGHAIMAGLAVTAAAAILYGAVRRVWVAPAVMLGVFLLAAVVLGQAYPAFVQKLHVEPNQLAREQPYLAWNLEHTRRAFGLDAAVRVPMTFRLPTAQTWQEAMPVLRRLPLWDRGPLQTAWDEVQTTAAYYHFPDVDYDRYDGEQVAVAVREFTAEGMTVGTRTWHTLHLDPTYTRGVGIVVSPAARKQAGEPVYWLSYLAPVQRAASAPPTVHLDWPAVYFGETMTDYVVLDETATDSMIGGDPTIVTGVPLSSFARVLAFAWRFGDQNLIFARELGPASRVVFRRRVQDRVTALAPFLLWDDDAYPVLRAGRIVWILDGYSVSGTYPLARPLDVVAGVRVSYIRSAAKAVVDATTGAIELYAVADPDPILQAYRRAFPGLFRDWSDLPPTLDAHLRYPPLLLRVQADALEEFHLEEPSHFYSGQDIWQVPQDAQRAGAAPLYHHLRLPGADSLEYVGAVPFIARERQTITALLIARSDPGHYGELVLLEMPRDEQIRGPSQVQAVIEQDPVIAPQLSLLRTNNMVELGRLRIVPTDSSVLYAQPLFLSAQQRPIPQLHRVIVSDGTAVAMAAELEDAIAALRSPAATAPPRAADAQPTATATPTGAAVAGEISARALEIFREAEQRLRAGDFNGFGQSWERLRVLLEEWSREQPAR